MVALHFGEKDSIAGPGPEDDWAFPFNSSVCLVFVTVAHAVFAVLSPTIFSPTNPSWKGGRAGGSGGNGISI